MKVGDRVTASPMWKYEKASGEIIKITKEYHVIRWDGINGHWHYTEDQMKKVSKEEDISDGR